MATPLEFEIKNTLANWKVGPLPSWISEAPPERQWVLKRFIPARGINMISGQQKWSKKTFMNMVMALAVSSGQRFGPFIPGDHAGPVLYLLEEGDPSETLERWRALSAGTGLPITDNLIFGHHGGIALEERKWAGAICKKIEQYGIKMVVLDTLTTMKACDENSAQEMMWVVKGMQEMAAAGASVMAISHLGKAAKEGSDPDNEARGSGVVPQARDNHIALRNYVRHPSLVDMTLLQRGGEQVPFLVHWHLVNEDFTDKDGDEMKRLVKAWPEIVEVSEIGISKMKRKLEPETKYEKQELAQLLNVPQTIVPKLYVIFTQNGFGKKMGEKFITNKLDGG